MMNISTIYKGCLNRINIIKNNINNKFDRRLSDEDVIKLNRHKTFFIGFFYQYMLGAIVAGFAVQPLIKYSNPVYFSFTGIWLAFTIVSIYRCMVVSSVSHFINRRRLTFVMFFMILISVISITFLIKSAVNTSLEHDQYCYNLQVLVERGIDRDKNATIFNNMQCRIQSLNK